jgi:hypothetical protein
MTRNSDRLIEFDGAGSPIGRSPFARFWWSGEDVQFHARPSNITTSHGRPGRRRRARRLGLEGHDGAASILDPHGAEADDERAAVNTRREWSDAELNELGNMLVRGLSIEEIARSLRRDKIEVRDKIAEVGRACR